MDRRGGARLDSFDGLRAFAAGSVLLYHAGKSCGLVDGGTASQLLAGLKGGVTVFFVISGFVLYLPYARAIRAGGPLPGWRRYARRRAVRILPAYWVALTIVAVAPLSLGILSSHWWQFYGLAQIYSRPTASAGLSVAWSLCVEVSFYVLLPFLARGIARLAHDPDPARVVRSQLRVLGSLAAGSLALRLALAGSPFLPVPSSKIVAASSLPWLFDWFAIGMCLAVLASDWEAGSLAMPRLARLAARPWVCWLLAAEAFSLMIVTHGDFYLPQYSLFMHLVFGALAALIVLPAAGAVRSERRTPAIAFLCSPAVVWLGTISYGIYLWHVPVLDAIRGPFEGVYVHPTGAATAIATAAVAAVVTVAIAAASWYLVEQPAQRLFRGKRAPALAPARA